MDKNTHKSHPDVWINKATETLGEPEITSILHLNTNGKSCVTAMQDLNKRLITEEV